jgi:hypothetical protein
VTARKLQAALGLGEGSPIILYLQSPKEKLWGILLALQPAGIVVRCIELSAFEDWLRQEARSDDNLIGLTTVFYPMNRVEKMERDETVGPMVSYADRFRREVGRTVFEAIGMREKR